jgi:outer membrane protein TolC
MWTNFLKGSFVLGVFLIAIQSFAATELSLEELKTEVLKNNLDIKVQYEKYYQAQKGVSVAYGQFLPSANINLVNVNATLAILQSVVPTPSNWFIYQSSKELQVAEKFTTESIKLNILEGLTINYLNLKHQEAVMASLVEQQELLTSVLQAQKNKEGLGLATANDVFLAKRNLLQHKQDIFSLNTLMAAEKQALMIALNKSPNEELTLAALPAEHSIPGTSTEGIDLAIKNSPELRSYAFQAEAAKYMVASKKWSFISFNGIGFDYSANLAIERSNSRIIDLKADQIELKIRNQVYSSYDELDILNQRIELQEQVVTSTHDLDQRNTELYQSDMLSLNKYLDSKKALSSEERALIKLQMDRRVKIAQIERLLGLDASLNKVKEIPDNAIQIAKQEVRLRRGAKSITMKMTASESVMPNIMSVSYKVENVYDEVQTQEASNHFAYSFQLNVRGQYKVAAKIRLISGDVIERTEVVTIE